MRKMRSAVLGTVCCWIALYAASAQSGAAPVSLGASLRSIDPELEGKIGFNNRSYAEEVASAAAPGAAAARVETFTAPNGKQATVTIRNPKVDGSYSVPPMPPGKDPAAYFAEALAQAGHKTVVFPKRGIYEFTSGCPSGGPI